MTISVEIEDLNNSVQNHHHTMREIQRLLVNQVLVRDTTNITISNPDGGEFTVTHFDPRTGTAYVSSMLHTNMSAYGI